MTTPTTLTNIATALLQVIGLLFPVVFLTMNFVKDEGYEDFSAKYREKLSKTLILMIIPLTISGFLGSISLVISNFREILLTIGVLSLAIFFVLYGNFIRLVFKIAEDDFPS